MMAAFLLPFSFMFTLATGGGGPPLMAVFFVVNFLRHRCSPKGEDKTYMPQATYALKVAMDRYLPAPLAPVWHKIRDFMTAYCNNY